MQIRLTVLGGHAASRGGGRQARSYDVLVTAPAGTTLGAVAGALAAGSGSGQPARGSASTPALYAGSERLDPKTAVLGAPPLVDGAVVSLHAPADQHADPPSAAAAARLHVVGGPDAGGVHLLQGGQVRVGRSADADVPLDDPDVSRLHCAVTVTQDGEVTVADLRSTNGTALDGVPVGERPVPLAPGALLRVGESTLRLEHAAPGATAPPLPPSVPAVPDSEGHLRICLPPTTWADHFGGDGFGGDRPAAAPSVPAQPSVRPVPRPAGPAGRPAEPGGTSYGLGGAPGVGRQRTPSEGGATASDRRRDTPRRGSPGPAGEPRAGDVGAGIGPGAGTASGTGSASRGGEATRHVVLPPMPPRPPRAPERAERAPGGGRFGGMAGAISSWARRLTGAAGTEETPGVRPEQLAAEESVLRERWPDAAAVLLTALGPGPRLWERGAGHQDALTLRLGTCDLPADGGTLTAVPFTVCLREPEAFTLGLAGPRPRLAGLARSVLAQAAALHSPSALELVLISADRARTAEQRTDEWAWLNWLPHLRPAHGQDCRLLLAFDREQAEARTAELVRRLAEGPLGPGWVSASPAAVAEAAARREGPYTLVVVDGDPGSAALREAVARIAAAGPSVGAHVLCVAEQPDLLAADCGTVAVLDGDVATTLRVFPDVPTRLTLDAVSQAWAERFARALAPLREGEAGSPVVRSALPETARLLDGLDLALATPSKITARWAANTGPSGVNTGPSGAATAVLGAGTEGRVLVDLAGEGPHLMAGGAPGSGKTELLRSITAALAAAERPDRLALVLVDGGGHERGEGLRICTDLPHVSTYLSASDPVRMREFAQALTAELRRREAALAADGAQDARTAPPLPRQNTTARAPRAAGTTGTTGTEGELGAAPRTRTRVAAPPRLVVVVDDLDALVAPALGSTGRPAAGSMVRALEAVARDGARLGVHLVASTGRPERTAGTEADERSRLRIALRTEDPESAALLVAIEDPAGLDDTVPGRGYLRRPSGAVVPFQTGRVSGRIPRTATLRPTVVPLDWTRMGDPPTRRPVRELGNGPTDLALLASALQRAAESAGADPAPPLV